MRPGVTECIGSLRPTELGGTEIRGAGPDSRAIEIEYDDEPDLDGVDEDVWESDCECTTRTLRERAHARRDLAEAS